VNGVNEAERHDLSQRLSRVEGQVRGIKSMVDANQEPRAVLIQLMALQKATRAAATFLVKTQAIAHIRAQVRTALVSCPGECDHCDELLAIDRALEELDLDTLLQALLKVNE